MSEARMSNGPVLSAEAGKMLPPAGVTGWSLAGSPPDWVMILTLIYLALQIGLLLPKYWEKFTSWRDKK